MTVEVLTFGCRLNAYESEAIRARAAEAQLTDAVVVNTCAVTAEAVRQSRQAIRRLKRENPQRRILVNQQLERIPGQLLVFVRYTYPPHAFQDEWVYNRADIDGARIVWARDLGPGEDEKLLHYYPNRKVLLLQPDVRPPQLTDYPE